jgi:MerR family transcriptional regulator/heat shock protein HspR
VTSSRVQRDPGRPVYVISVAASIVSVHPRTLRIYEDEGLVCPARTPSNNRLYSEDDIRRVMWIRHLTRDRGVNLAGIRLLFELEERLGTRILEALFDEGMADRSEPPVGGPTDKTPEPVTSHPDGTSAPSDNQPATGTPDATPRRA